LKDIKVSDELHEALLTLKVKLKYKSFEALLWDLINPQKKVMG